LTIDHWPLAIDRADGLKILQPMHGPKRSVTVKAKYFYGIESSGGVLHRTWGQLHMNSKPDKRKAMRFYGVCGTQTETYTCEYRT
jgi:hypothetical protein